MDARNQLNESRPPPGFAYICLAVVLEEVLIYCFASVCSWCQLLWIHHALIFYLLPLLLFAIPKTSYWLFKWLCTSPTHPPVHTLSRNNSGEGCHIRRIWIRLCILPWQFLDSSNVWTSRATLWDPYFVVVVSLLLCPADECSIPDLGLPSFIVRPTLSVIKSPSLIPFHNIKAINPAAQSDGIDGILDTCSINPCWAGFSIKPWLQ